MRMLGGGKARMVGQHTDAVTHLKAIEYLLFIDIDLTMFLRNFGDPHSRFVAVEGPHSPVAALRVEMPCAGVL